MLKLIPFKQILQKRLLSAAGGGVPTMRQLREAIVKHIGAVPSTVSEFDPKVAHPPSASATRCVIPLSSDPTCQLRYVNASGQARSRFGMLMEDLDMFAVWIAFRHNQPIGLPMGTPGHHPMLIVTACVDGIDVPNKVIRSDLDIIMDGFISWVGKSSLEVTMNLKQKYAEQDLRDILTAKFVMVSQDPETRKSVRNVPLLLETGRDEENFHLGEQAKNLRIAREKNSLLRTVPTGEERNILHALFLKTIDESSQSFERHLPSGHVWMQDAKLKNAVICFPIKQNLYGKIFGGYLMRVAFESAWANACVFSHKRVRIAKVGNIMFRKPVEVGSLLLFSSQVCYSSDELIQVSVAAQVLNLNTGEKDLTNTFQFTFKVDSEDETSVPIVLPKTYEDGILYLDGRRHALD
uniref:HotDog ACOT-type domain-containing protein n=2 Tax=Panagrolaimus sp. JU765 TaxID=591449 RepID=A0AC34RJV8_9BILA